MKPKKIMALALTIIMALGMTACGGNAANTDNSSPKYESGSAVDSVADENAVVYPDGVTNIYVDEKYKQFEYNGYTVDDFLYKDKQDGGEITTTDITVAKVEASDPFDIYNTIFEKYKEDGSITEDMLMRDAYAVYNGFKNADEYFEVAGPIFELIASDPAYQIEASPSVSTAE